MEGKRKTPSWWRRFWIEMAIGFVILSVANWTIYFFGYIDVYGLLRNTATLFLIIGFCYMIQHIKTEVLSEKGLLTLNKIAYVLLGACLMIAISLFGVEFMLKTLGLPPLPTLIGTWPAIISTLIVSPIIGGFLGYKLGKRRKFQPPKIP